MKNRELGKITFITSAVALGASVAFAIYVFRAPTEKYSPPPVNASIGDISNGAIWQTFDGSSLGIKFDYPVEWGSPEIQVGIEGLGGRPDWPYPNGFEGMGGFNRSDGGENPSSNLSVIVTLSEKELEDFAYGSGTDLISQDAAESVVVGYPALMQDMVWPESYFSREYCQIDDVVKVNDRIYVLRFSYSGQSSDEVERNCEIWRVIKGNIEFVD